MDLMFPRFSRPYGGSELERVTELVRRVSIRVSVFMKEGNPGNVKQACVTSISKQRLITPIPMKSKKLKSNSFFMCKNKKFSLKTNTKNSRLVLKTL